MRDPDPTDIFSDGHRRPPPFVPVLAIVRGVITTPFQAMQDLELASQVATIDTSGEP